MRVVVERAAEIALGKAALLDHRAHRAVEDQDALGEKSRDFGGMIWLHRTGKHAPRLRRPQIFILAFDDEAPETPRSLRLPAPAPAGGDDLLPQSGGLPVRRPPGRGPPRGVERGARLGGEPAFRRTGEESREHEPPDRADLSQRPALDR